ncbi:MAG: hypothetical protein JJU33_12295 [Phycisphaerales bacterium]|nr:hypothetical protein [Phycisphaerales bacterium]
MSGPQLSEEGVERRERMLDELRPIVRRRPRVARARAGMAAGLLGAVVLGVFWQFSMPKGVGPGEGVDRGPTQVADAGRGEPEAAPRETAVEASSETLAGRGEGGGEGTRETAGEEEGRKSRIVIVRSDPSVIGRVKIAGREPTLTRIIGDDDLAKELGPRGIGVVRTADGVFLTGDPTERPGRSMLDAERATESIE